MARIVTNANRVTLETCAIFPFVSGTLLVIAMHVLVMVPVMAPILAIASHHGLGHNVKPLRVEQSQLQIVQCALVMDNALESIHVVALVVGRAPIAIFPFAPFVSMETVRGLNNVVVHLDMRAPIALCSVAMVRCTMIPMCATRLGDVLRPILAYAPST